MTIQERDELDAQSVYDMRVFAAYVACALWSGLDEDEARELREQLRRDICSNDIAAESLEKMARDVRSFVQLLREKTIDGAPLLRDDMTPEYIGHNFWLTRNGHGAGFWDTPRPDGLEENLTVWAHSYGECNLYLGDDGLIYIF